MRLASLTLAAVVLALSACSAPQSSASQYALAEFSIEGPQRLASGQSTVTVTNSGEFPHTLVIADRSGEVVAATDLVQPGEAVDLDMDLPEGDYQFTCRIVAEKADGEIVDHFERGMNATVAVGG